MKLSLSIQTPEVEPRVPVALLSGSFEEKLAKAARFGADGVELMTTDPASIAVAALKFDLRRHGLGVAAIASGAMAFALGLTLLHADPDKAVLAQARLWDMIELAAAVEAPVVTIGSFRGWVSSSGPGARERLMAIVGQAGACAERHGVRLVLEALNRYEADVIRTADEGLDFIRAVGSSAVGLLLDTFHVNIEENSWTEPFRRAMDAGRLWHVHLGDNNRLYPGRGLIDFAAIVATLRAGGYTGYLSAELFPQPDADAAAQGTLATMRELLGR